jgi:hypothetical protein
LPMTTTPEQESPPPPLCNRPPIMEQVKVVVWGLCRGSLVDGDTVLDIRAGKLREIREPLDFARSVGSSSSTGLPGRRTRDVDPPITVHARNAGLLTGPEHGVNAPLSSS